MNLLKTILLSVLFLFSSFTEYHKPSKKLFTFLQLTDIQMGMTSKNLNFEEEIRLYSLAVVQINKIKPDFVVITGDFVNNRTDTNQIIAFKKLTSLINKKIPVYLIPGNHDLGQVPDNESLNFYYKHYSTENFNFLHHGVHLIGINSCYINSGTEWEIKQLNWLKEALGKKPANARTIVFSHHPFFVKDINEKDNYSNIPVIKRKEYLQLFKQEGVEIIFAGHYHNNSEAQFDGIRMITTSAVGKQLGEAKSGFRKVTVYTDKIEHQYVEL